MLYQKFCLFTLLNIRISPIVSSNSTPFDFVQVSQAREISKVIRASIGSCESPFMIGAIRPLNHIVQVGFQVYYWLLPASIREIRIIRHINYIKHYRPRTEIKWHAIPDVQAGMTGELQAEPPLLYVIHTDGCTR